MKYYNSRYQIECRYISSASHRLKITSGEHAEGSIVVSDQLESREHICLAVSMDYDIVDGAHQHKDLSTN